MHAGAGNHDSPKLLVGLAEINDPRVLMGSGSLVQVWVVSGRPMLVSIERGESWRFPFKVSARSTCGRQRARANLGRVGTLAECWMQEQFEHGAHWDRWSASSSAIELLR